MARERSTNEAPLLVVGAGACGIVAALAAAKRGTRTLLLEKGAEIGGNTARSTDLIPAAGTRFDEVIEAGKVVRSETSEDVAGTLGLPAGTLAETIAETNR